jgi:enoyl-CoA hydratase/carnithine racemase
VIDPARYDDITVAVDDGVATVTFDRPPRNALVPTTMLEVRDAFARLDTDETVRCIILTGAGTFFSGGADLTRPGLFDPETGRIDRDLMRRLRADHRRDRELINIDPLAVRVPLIAAINGSAAGGGLTVTLQTDIRIIAEDARLSFAFAQRGLSPEMGATWLLPRLVGQSMAMELMLTGRPFDGIEAQRMGFASRAVPRAEVLPVAESFARDIATKSSPLAITIVKRMLWAHGAEPSYVAVTRTEKDVIDWITALPDGAEGMRSFMEKRAPQWSTTGREALPGFVPTLFETAVEDY